MHQCPPSGKIKTGKMSPESKSVRRYRPARSGVPRARPRGHGLSNTLHRPVSPGAKRILLRRNGLTESGRRRITAEAEFIARTDQTEASQGALFHRRFWVGPLPSICEAAAFHLVTGPGTRPPTRPRSRWRVGECLAHRKPLVCHCRVASEFPRCHSIPGMEHPHNGAEASSGDRDE